MAEEHNGLNNGRLDETAYLQQCDLVLRERERLMRFELERFREVFFHPLRHAGPFQVRRGVIMNHLIHHRAQLGVYLRLNQIAIPECMGHQPMRRGFGKRPRDELRDFSFMKICVLGLDCAAPEIVFGDERLVNIRRLMELGVYGRLQSVIPPITVPAWMCMSTSQDPGSLGAYGFRNRSDHSYEKLAFANSASIKALSIWDQLAREGKKSIIIGVPPNYSPRRVNGISIGCFLTPDTTKDDFTYPPSFKTKITELVGEYPVDMKNFRTERKDWPSGQNVS
jgi:Type I phosphodiesterase / nucleotide pyrophosphatase